MPFQPRHGAGGDQLGVDVELALQFLLPLLAQVRRTEHGHALDLAPVQQLAGNQAGLNGLADTHVVGDQQADDFMLERHQQGHQLIGARLHIDATQGAERAGAGAQFQ